MLSIYLMKVVSLPEWAQLECDRGCPLPCEVFEVDAPVMMIEVIGCLGCLSFCFIHNAFHVFMHWDEY